MAKAESWSFKRVFVACIFSAATFAIAFVLGNAITASFGPGTSGIATIIVTTILVIICARIVETRGLFTLVVTLFTVFAIPTNIFGPPGPHKIAVGLLTGLVYDLVWELSGRRRFSLRFSAAAATAASIAFIFFLMTFLHHPRADYLRSVLSYIIPLYTILGFAGAWIGEWIYEKNLKDTSIVAQLRS